MANAEPAQSRPSFKNVDDFYGRGERAWNEYRRTGVASSVDAVFDRIDALAAARRAQLSTEQGRKQG